MAEAPTHRILRWLFGVEGTVAAESEMQVVMAGTAVAAAGIYAMSPIVSALTGPFGVSDARIGAIITVYTAPSILLVPVVGLLADRYGRRIPLVAGLMLVGLGGISATATTSFLALLACRAVQGVGFAAIMPLGVTIIGDLYADGREATAQGFRVAAIQLQGLVVPPLAGGLVLVAWEAPFLLYAFALPVAVWAWFALPTLAPSDGGPSLRSYVGELLKLLRQPTLAAILLSFVVRFALVVGYFAYISVLMTHTLGASAVETGLVVSMVGVVALVGSTQAGRLVVGYDSMLVLLMSLVAIGAGLVVMGAAPSYLTVGLGSVLLGVGIGVSGAVQKSLVTQLSPDGLRAGTVSSALLFQSIGQTSGPLLLGLLVAWTDVVLAFVGYGVVGGTLGAVLVAVAYRTGRRATPTARV